MGTTVTVDISAGTEKKDHTVATTAAGSVACDNDQLVIFVGSNLYARSAEVVNAVKYAFRRLSLAGNPTPSTDQFAYAWFDAGFLPANLTVAEDAAALPTLGEDDVLVVYSDLFQARANIGIGGYAVKAVESLVEAFRGGL